MAINNYSTDLWVFTVNARIINDWGETATPFTVDPIDPRSVLRRGQGGNAVRLDRINPGVTINIYLNPGSEDSVFMRALFNDNATISVGAQQIGTLETYTGTEGIITNFGQIGRGGSTITDDQFMIEFNAWTNV